MKNDILVQWAIERVRISLRLVLVVVWLGVTAVD